VEDFLVGHVEPATEYDLFVAGQPGTDLVAVTAARFKSAADEVIASFGPDRLLKLNIRAGEHLAGMITTCFLESVPTEIDTDGGPDLVFDNYRPSKDWQREWLPIGPAAFEVKSMGSNFRKLDSQIDRTISRGGDPTGMGVYAIVNHSDNVLKQARPLILRARKQLLRKTSRAYSRNVFLIVDPIDHITVELFSAVTGPYLKPLRDFPDLDTVWVHWPTEKITVWSKKANRWFNGVVGSRFPLREGVDRFISIQDVERYFLEQIGYPGQPPFVVNLKARDDD
jgi:hypothetical protein